MSPSAVVLENVTLATPFIEFCFIWTGSEAARCVPVITVTSSTAPLIQELHGESAVGAGGAGRVFLMEWKLWCVCGGGMREGGVRE